MAGHTKPQNKYGYSAQNTEACEQVLVTLLNTFGTLKHTLRLVGGLVPRYLTPEQPPAVPAHFGTTDVDIVLNLAVIAEGQEYASLHEQLVNNGFWRYADAKRPEQSWRWEYPLTGNAVVLVEFLQGSNGGGTPGRPVLIDEEGVSALVIPFAEMAHDWFCEKKISAELMDGKGIAIETIRFADPVSFIILKAISFDNRKEPKDSADLIHVMRYAGEPEYIAELFVQRIGSGLHPDAIATGLNALQKCFAEGNDDIEGYRLTGPVCYGKFLFGDDAGSADERLREQRYAAGLVTAVLAMINSRRDAEHSVD